MADIDLKTLTPDTSLPTTGFLFGADSQAVSSPSVYSTQTVATTLLGSTTLSGATITADAPVLNMSQTWNNGAVTFTGLKFNAAGTSDANSAAASLLMDLQVGGASRFTVNKLGLFQAASSVALNTGYSLVNWNLAQFGWGSSGTVNISTNPDTILTRRGTANLRLGAADTTGTTAPTPQFLSAQSWLSSTTNNQTGANFTIDGSQGTGTGAGGSIIFRVAPAGGTSNGVQNGLSAALTIASNLSATFAGNVLGSDFRCDYLRANAFVQLGGTSGGYISGPANDTFRLNSIAGLTVDLTVEANNTLALRNGNEGQTFRLYGRFTDITNDFERFFINAPTTSGAAVLLGTQKGATTGAARALEFQTDGTTRLTIGATGGFTFVNSLTINSGDVLVTGGTGVRVAAAGAFWFDGRNDITSPSDGVLRFRNGAGNDFNRLQFGGTTSSFPALKRNGTALETKLADDTAYAPHAMQYLDVTDGVTAPASATGRARIYVDTADGDLKVIFADGTVKTIVTDT